MGLLEKILAGKVATNTNRRSGPFPASDSDSSVASGNNSSVSGKTLSLELQRILSLERIDEHPLFDDSLIKKSNSVIKLREVQLKALAALRDMQGGFFPLGTGFGKCLRYNTEIYDPKEGVRLVVGEVEEAGKPVTVQTFDEKGNSVIGSANVWLSGVKECVRLSLQGGQRVELSKDHPVLTYRGWVEAESIKETDLVAVPRRVPAPNKTLDVTDSEVKLLAYVVAGKKTFTNAESKVLEDFNAAVIAVQFEESNTAIVAVKNDKYEWLFICGINFFIEKYSLSWCSCQVKERRIPANYYGLSDKHVATFLNRFWAYNGQIDVENRVLECTLTSEKLVEDLRFFCLRLGIIVKSSVKSESWRITIQGKENLVNFFNCVGEILGKEQVCKDLLTCLLIDTGDTCKSGWPSSSDLFWEEVKSIEGIGSNIVFDLSVPDTHNFVGNGIVLHNTYVSLLAAKAMDRKHGIYIVPAPTKHQMQAERKKLRRSFKFTTVDIVKYSELSATSGECPLEPYLRGYEDHEVVLICDEAHKLKHKSSARTKRVIRFVRNHPKVAVVCLSGTMTSKSLMDYHHIMLLCLREKIPLPIPIKGRELKNWADTLDVEGACAWSSFMDMEPVLRRYDPTIDRRAPTKIRKERARKAFQKHLSGAKGIVCTDEASLGVSLLIGKLSKIPVFSDDLKAIIKMVQEDGVSPDGEEYADPSEIARALNQLSMGFFYRWVWPNGKPDLHWLETRSEWNRQVRWQLSYNAKEGYDTTALVERGVRGRIAEGKEDNLTEALKAWDKHRHKSDPPTETVWLDDSILRWACERAKKYKMCLWYKSKAVAQRIQELYPSCRVYRTGDKVPSFNETIPIGQQYHFAAYSAIAHREGLNLQHYSKGLVLEPPSDGGIWEQVLSRLHRPLQPADEVMFEVLQHTNRYRRCLFTAIKRAAYSQASTGLSQRLCIAVYYKVQIT